MELIGKLSPRKNKKGIVESWGYFYCVYCKNYVERKLSDGLRQKSCGCSKNRLQALTLKGRKRTETFKLKVSIGNKGKKRTEEQKKKYSESHKGIKPSEDVKQRISLTLKGRKNPGMSEFQKQYWTGERKKERSKLYIGKFVGELSPSWQGGISFEPYGLEFNKKLKKFIKNRDISMCQTPNCMNTENLCIHHIDYNKQNNSLENLITLCRSCHSKTNGKNNRQYWIEFYTNIITIYL